MNAAGVTVVLSGGGAKTAAHAGAVRALLEAGRTPVRYVATSMGAVVAAALASGTDPAVLVPRLAEAGRMGVVRERFAVIRGLFARSLLRPTPFRRAVEGLVAARRFADLSIPIAVTVADLETGEQVLFGDGGEDAPLIEVLCAACALPVYFPPVTLAGRRCGDGGLRGPLPLGVAARLAREPVVAVDVGPGYDAVEALAEGERGGLGAAPPVVRAHDEAIGVLMAAATAAELAGWRADASRPALTYVRPRIERHATFRVDRMLQYAEDGYRAVREALAAPLRT